MGSTVHPINGQYGGRIGRRLLARLDPHRSCWLRQRYKLGCMDLVTHFRLLARYNRIANERLFAACAQLDDAEYRKRRAGSFGSIHGLLNHILLGDRRWMALFEHGERLTPPLDQILCDDFSGLRSARAREDCAGSSRSSAGSRPGSGGGRSPIRITRAEITSKRPMWHAAICSITRPTIERRSM